MYLLVHSWDFHGWESCYNYKSPFFFLHFLCKQSLTWSCFWDAIRGTQWSDELSNICFILMLHNIYMKTKFIPSAIATMEWTVPFIHWYYSNFCVLPTKTCCLLLHAHLKPHRDCGSSISNLWSNEWRMTWTRKQDLAHYQISIKRWGRMDCC